METKPPVSASKELPKGGTVYAPTVAYVSTAGVTGGLWKKKTESSKQACRRFGLPFWGSRCSIRDPNTRLRTDQVVDSG